MRCHFVVEIQLEHGPNVSDTAMPPSDDECTGQIELSMRVPFKDNWFRRIFVS